MKTKWVLLSMYVILGNFKTFAQDKQLSIQQAIELATNQSKQAKAADTKVTGKMLELAVSKNSQLPDAKISGQFGLLSSPDVNLRIPLGNEGSPMQINANQLMLGQVNISVPLYAGGKIKNGIHIAESSVEAERYTALNVKEQLATQVIKLYVSLYTAKQTSKLMQENIKRSTQQVDDFNAMEKNGLIARNDLLKAELQLSNYRVALQEADKNVNVINYQLVTLLQLDESTKITPEDFPVEEHLLNQNMSIDEVYNNRYDLKLLESQHHIAEDRLKISKADYLPSVALTGGYVAADIKNVIAITNAMNIGVGLSYDLGSIYKNKKNVDLAKHNIIQLEQQIDIAHDKVKIQLQQANENFSLAKNQELVYKQAVEQANENYRIVKDKYDNGVADTDDLLEADVQQVQSQINEAVSKANVLEKYYDLLLANGQLISNNI